VVFGLSSSQKGDYPNYSIARQNYINKIVEQTKLKFSKGYSSVRQAKHN